MKNNHKNHTTADVKKRSGHKTDPLGASKKVQESREKEQTVSNNKAAEEGGEIEWQPTKRISPGFDEEG
jgi:hypothetical protein